jgi:hypothetical protein
MTNSTRSINEVLYFRSDISPFLVHLTKKKESKTAKDILTNIINEKQLVANNSFVSDIKYATNTSKMNDDEKRKLFGAVCLTETPINEIYCLLGIAKSQVNLEPYGLVFIKDNLRRKGVSPVLYFNNEQDDKYEMFQALSSLKEKYPKEAAKLFPLISVFGEKIHNPDLNSHPGTQGTVDFLWEREWRYPTINGDLLFTQEDIFIGLCPHEEIEEFENLLPNIKFIDPMRNVKWYANKLVEARQRCEMKYSVV